MVDFKKLTAKNRAAIALEMAGVDLSKLAAVKVDDSPVALTIAEEIEREKNFVEPIVDLDAKPEPPPIILSDEQESVVAAAMRMENLLITGSAGTGKSTLLKELVKRCDGRLPVTASTGISAVNVGGMTIHSYAGLGLGDEPAEKIARNVMGRDAVKFRLRQFNRMAIDEISMISADLFDKLDQVLRIVRENDRPFGGMQIIALGDFCQLPPVTKGNDDGAKFAFESKAWREGQFRVCLLKKVFRQSEAEFSQALNDIRLGIVSPVARKILVSRFQQPDPDPTIEAVQVYTTNVDVDAKNAARLAEIEGKEIEYRAHDSGEPAQVAMLQKNCLAPEFLKLKVGAQVMLLKNLDVNAGLANGSMGKITELPGKGANYGGPTVKFNNGITIKLERDKWEIILDGKILATRQQYPLRLAYAVTAHKSQGMSLDKIKVHLGNVFEDGQAYVALSRARTKEGLFIESTKAGCIRASRAAVDFYERAETL